MIVQLEAQEWQVVFQCMFHAPARECLPLVQKMQTQLQHQGEAMTHPHKTGPTGAVGADYEPGVVNGANGPMR